MKTNLLKLFGNRPTDSQSPSSVYSSISKRTMAYLLVVASVTFSACQQDEVDTLPKAEIEAFVTGDVSSIKDYLATEVARTIAFNISSHGVKNFIKNEALDKFDGDYNFLVSTALGKSIELEGSSSDGSFTFADLLHQGSPYERSQFNIVDSIEKYYPLMQVMVTQLTPNMVKEWDIESHSPLVGFIPSGKDPKKYPSFDTAGNIVELDAAIAPDQLVVLINENERTTDLEKSSLSDGDCTVLSGLAPYHSTKYKNIYLKKDYFDALNECALAEMGFEDSNTSGRTLENWGDCRREANPTYKDHIYGFKLNSSTVYNDANDDCWGNNDMEFRCDIFLATSNGSVTKISKYFDVDEDDVDNLQWYHPGGSGIYTFHWVKSSYGTAVKYSWLEDDGGGTTTVSTSFTTNINGTNVTATANYSVPTNHYEFRDALAGYCDILYPGNAYTYNTGRLTFIVDIYP